jgi:hypothetical protein
LFRKISWGWEWHPLCVEISPSKLSFLSSEMIKKKANLQSAILHLLFVQK